VYEECEVLLEQASVNWPVVTLDLSSLIYLVKSTHHEEPCYLSTFLLLSFP
jgi:hypothetical protein